MQLNPEAWKPSRYIPEYSINSISLVSKFNYLCFLNRLETQFLQFLLKIGATCVVSKMRDLPYEKVTLLADHRVIRMSAKPIEMTLQLAALFCECSKREQLHSRELSLSESMQSLAVEMMDKAHRTEDNIGQDLFEYGIENNQKMVSHFARRNSYQHILCLNSLRAHSLLVHTIP